MLSEPTHTDETPASAVPRELPIHYGVNIQEWNWDKQRYQRVEEARMNIGDLDTPAVLVDVDIMERNLRRLATYCSEHLLNLRPHTKTHKIPELARRQTALGAVGITVAKVGEAEVMADAGLNDILIVYPIVGEPKLCRLMALASRVRLTVAADSFEVAQEISSHAVAAGCKIGFLVEFNTGFRRCGLPVRPSSIDVAQRIRDLPGLKWRGVLVYPGHIMGTAATRPGLIRAENRVLADLIDLLTAAGIPYPVVSGGNTPAAYASHEFSAITEIRPGTYIFNDGNTVCAEAASWPDCAARVWTTVVSRSVQGRAIIDAGSKTLTADRLLSGDGVGFGHICDYPDIAIEDLSEEHGHLDTTRSSRIPGLGQRLQVIPNHICPVMNLHDIVYGVQDQRVICTWNVAARGKVN
jgi:D-serine deaminase-like pyridoxal phosphate-dependent protein